MDEQERDNRLIRLEVSFEALKKSLDLVRQEGKERGMNFRRDLKESIHDLQSELNEYVLLERHIWLERVVIGLLAGFVGYGLNSLVSA